MTTARTKVRVNGIVGVVLTSLLLLPTPPTEARLRSSAEAKARKRASEISGTIRVNGCALSPSEIRLQAEPMTAGDPAQLESVPVRETVARQRPGSPRFKFRDLQPGMAYRLGVSLPADRCGKVFWRGPNRGLSFSGRAPEAVEGFAATTEVEVLQIGGARWLGVDELPLTDDATSLRRFRWRSRVPGVVAGELQIATRAFPTRGAFGACDEPQDAVVYRRTISTTTAPIARARGRQTRRTSPGDWSEIDLVDFGQILAPKTQRCTNCDGQSELTVLDRRRVLNGAPLYVRVVPITAEGPACDTAVDGVPGWAILAHHAAPDLPPTERQAPPPSPPVGRPAPPPPPEPVESPLRHWASNYKPAVVLGQPTYAQVGYKVIKPHKLPPLGDCLSNALAGGGCGGFGCDASPSAYATDPFGCSLVMSGKYPQGTELNRGDVIVFTPNRDLASGLGEHAVQMFEGVVLVTGQALAFGPNLASHLYTEIQDAVEDVVKDGIMLVPVVSDICKSEKAACDLVVHAALEAGLTAMGAPPSLPNWEDLKEQGIEYLATELAAQTVPPEVAEEFAKRTLEMAENAFADMTARRGGSDPACDWVIPYEGLEPAILTTTVLARKDAVLPENLVLHRPRNGVYAATTVPLRPAQFKSNESPWRWLTIPMVLYPDFTDIPAPACKPGQWNGPTTCEPKYAPSDPPTCSWFYGVQNGLPPDDDCSSPDGQHVVSVYYRNAWVNPLNDVPDCAGLALSSFTEDVQWSFTDTDVDVDLGFSLPDLGLSVTVTFTPFPEGGSPLITWGELSRSVPFQWAGLEPFHGCPSYVVK